MTRNYPRTVYFTPLWPYIFSFDDSYNLSRTVYFTLWRPFLFIRYFFKKWNRIISALHRIYYADDRIFSVQNRIFYQGRIFSRTVYFTFRGRIFYYLIDILSLNFWSCFASQDLVLSARIVYFKSWSHTLRGRILYFLWSLHIHPIDRYTYKLRIVYFQQMIAYFFGYLIRCTFEWSFMLCT